MTKKLQEDFGRTILTKPIQQWEDKPLSNYKDYFWQIKEDGMRLVAHKGKMYTRSGIRCKNADYILKWSAWEGCDFQATTFDMEASSQSHSAEEIAGLFNSNAGLSDLEKRTVKVHVFDAIPSAHFEAGFSQMPYRERRKKIPPELKAVEYKPVEHITLRVAQEQASSLDVEGFCLWHKLGTWSTKRNWEARKVTKQVFYDCPIMSINGGQGKRFGTVGYITVLYKDEIIGVDLGKGWDDKARLHMWEHKEEYLNKIIEIYAKETSTNGILRQPKAGRLRRDKGGEHEEAG